MLPELCPPLENETCTPISSKNILGMEYSCKKAAKRKKISIGQFVLYINIGGLENFINDYLENRRIFPFNQSPRLIGAHSLNFR